jgi:hypothetical protein
MTYKDLDNKQMRDSGMALTLICLVAVWLFEKELFLPLSMIVLVVTMTKPILLKPFAFVWLNLSHYVGTGISKVLLIVIFIGLVIPIGVILKLTGKDSMFKKKWKDGSGASVMVERNHLYTSKDLKNPF